MHVLTCPGFPASWVNAWLAGIGMTVLDGRIRLNWTAEDTPVAVLSSVDLNPVEALVESWPNETFLRELPISEKWNGAGELKRKVPVEQFIARVREARGHPHAWTLSSTMTDLSIDQNGEVAHAPFDPAGPGTTKWLHHRLLRIHELAGPVSDKRLRDSLVGQAKRVKNNGLTDGLLGQNMLDAVGGGFRHASPATARTEAAALATERHQLFMPAGIALDAQESVFEAPAFQVRLELFSDEVGE